MRSIVGLLVATALCLSAPTLAFGDIIEDETPTYGTFELKFSSYKPNIDKEFGGSGSFTDYYGKGGLLTEIAVDYHLWQKVGAVSLGLSIGYFNRGAPSVNADGTDSADKTRLVIFPTRLSAVYRFDYLQDEFNIPLVLSVRGGLDYYFWWVLASNKIADTADRKGSGGTVGWHAGATLYLLLDVMAPGMANSLDHTAGINNSYIFAEFLSAHVDDFGGENSWKLGDNTFMFGLGFEF